MAPRKRRDNFQDRDPKVQEATPENLRIEIDQIFKEFLANSDMAEYAFTANLNNLQRKYIHEKAKDLNLTSKSYGKDHERRLHIRKKMKPINAQSFYLKCCPATDNALYQFVQLSCHVANTPRKYKNINLPEKVFGKLADYPPSLVPFATIEEEMSEFKENLPIFSMKSQIIATIKSNQVVIVSSETGSGKTTQIPQYIMEDMHEQNLPCKIICTQPRRISTVGVAERVADERSDDVGASVGYHIRLEHKYGMNTNLIYCTNGVMLRTLMSTDSHVLGRLTHVIIDEVHERDRLSDFLLICLKKALSRYPSLRVILMSATVNVEKFRSYFGSAAILTVPGRMYSIYEYFLDEIICDLKYMSPAMLQMHARNDGEDIQGVLQPDVPIVRKILDPNLINIHMDLALDEYFACEDDDFQAATQLEVYFFSENVPVDYQHSSTGMTALMIASYQGDVDTISRLCSMGADMYMCCNKGKTCFDYAIDNKQYSILQVLNYVKKSYNIPDEPVNKPTSPDLLLLYDKTQRDEDIDFDLIVWLINRIHNSNEPGAILVFLPGYDDIMICNDRIEEINLRSGSYKTFFLHGSMSIRDQHEVFKNLENKRKIILSTNIAETSITINDVVFVIDSGRAKEKSYDSYNKLSSLQTQWISKACAKQRAGRSGRTAPGKCFHIYSAQRFHNLDAERVPEILRVSLDELCLHTKILAPRTMRIHEFLSFAPDPPSVNAVKVSIESLVELGALDAQENLTQLGEYLAQLTVDPHLGKMLIYSVIFKCLEPVLTLTAALAHKDPFQMPPQANLRSAAAEKRRNLTEGVLSDHMIYLKAFQKFHSYTGRSWQFCNEYFLSHSTMETVLETRRQLLVQLRAAGFVHHSRSLDEYNVNANSWPMVKAIICSGLYPHIAYPLEGCLSTRNMKKVNIPNTSVLSRANIQSWLIYDELIKNRQNILIKGVTAVTPMTVALVTGNYAETRARDNLIIDDWLDFEVSNELLINFRFVLKELINKVLSNPANRYSDLDHETVQTLNAILTAEDNAANFVKVEGLGCKPRFVFKPGDRSRHGNFNSRNAGPPVVEYAASSSERGFNRNCYGQQQRYARQPPRDFAGAANHLSNNFQRNVQIGGRTCYNRPRDRQQVNLNAVALESANVGGDGEDNVFVLITPRQAQSVRIAYKTSKWVFAPQTEKKLLDYTKRNKVVHLIFSVKTAGTLNGIAQFRFLMECDRGKPTALIEWQHAFEVDCDKFRHLRNPFNNHRAVFDGLDGQIIERNVAMEVVRIFREIQVEEKPKTPKRF